MAEDDTIKLLRECDSGIKMGVSSIEDVLDYTRSDELRRTLKTCRDRHETLRREMQELLREYQDEGKEPSPVAKGMSWIKTNMKLVLENSDQTIAELMTDGCNMGVKSLNRYLNQYEYAEEKARDLAKRLIALEEGLAVDIRQYL